jgi:hypothetical protein
MKYSLIILFQSKNQAILYEGPSIDKGSVDQLIVRGNCIALHFDRLKKMTADELLYSPRSKVRTQIQRVLTFYLAIQGTIPPLHSIELHCDDQVERIAHQHFTRTWSNCYTTKKFNSTDLASLFIDEPASKVIYSVLTYWLKSKLDEFVYDQFRFLWSGFNAIYEFAYQMKHPSNSNRVKSESEKLQYFEKVIMKSIKFKETLTYLEALPDDFYIDQVNWSKYVSNKSCNHLVGICSKYPDAIISQQITKYANVVYPDQTKLLNEMTQISKQQAGIVNQHSRLKFLLMEMIYLKRSQHFHAEDHHPLFIISAPDQRLAEQYYCEILQLVIVDSIKSMDKIVKSANYLTT